MDMGALIGAILILTVVLAALVLPALLKEWSLKRFLLAMFLSFFVVLLPFAFFLLSMGLEPDSKDGCHHGWIDCFVSGKIMLTPLVLWAVTALYAVEIYEVADPTCRWIAQGLFIGAVISSACLVFGFVIYSAERSWWPWLLVPLYTAVWYVLRDVHITRDARVKSSVLSQATLWSAPFWVLSLFWSYKHYLALPDHPPGDCFVVTAASRGHRRFVGPFMVVAHRGRRRLANHQLATLWQFEHLWRSAAPRSHAMFRRVYNRIGPVIARRVVSPWTADAVYVALKPLEIAAAISLNLAASYQPLLKFQTRR